jgi:hypothetical protein
MIEAVHLLHPSPRLTPALVATTPPIKVEFLLTPPFLPANPSPKPHANARAGQTRRRRRRRHPRRRRRRRGCCAGAGAGAGAGGIRGQRRRPSDRPVHPRSCATPRPSRSPRKPSSLMRGSSLKMAQLGSGAAARAPHKSRSRRGAEAHVRAKSAQGSCRNT